MGARVIGRKADRPRVLPRLQRRRSASRSSSYHRHHHRDSYSRSRSRSYDPSQSRSHSRSRRHHHSRSRHRHYACLLEREGNPPFSQGNGRSKIWDPIGSPILLMEGENDEKIKELRSKIAILKAVGEGRSV